MNSELQTFYEEYIALLEQSNENAYRRLAKIGQFANKDDIILGKKYRTWIAEAKNDSKES